MSRMFCPKVCDVFVDPARSFTFRMYLPGRFGVINNVPFWGSNNFSHLHSLSLFAFPVIIMLCTLVKIDLGQ